MKKLFMPILRSLFWGVLIGLTLAVLEVFGILAYLQWRGVLENKYLYLSDFFSILLFYGILGVGLGLMCGLFWVLLSPTSWYRSLKSAQVRAWEKGLLIGLLFFFYLGVVVHTRIFTDVPFNHPTSLAVSVGLLLISAGLAVFFGSAVIALNHRMRMKVTVTLMIATVVATAFFGVMSWHNKFLRQDSASEEVATAKLEGNSSSERPNILFITIDTLRADHISAYGYDKIRTKNIDSLAEEGILFEQAIAQAPSTKASFASIWTSLYTSQVYLVNRTASSSKRALFKRLLRDDVPMMAEFFSDAGYITIGLNTNPNLRVNQEFGRGFQLYLYQESQDLMYTFRYSILYNSILYNILNKTSPLIVSLIERITDKYRNTPDKSVFSTFNEKLSLYAAKLFKFNHSYGYAPAERVYHVFSQIIERLEVESKPFFFWVHFMDPHDPYHPLSPVKLVANGQMYASISLGDIEQLLKENDDVSAVKDVLVKMYDSQILYLDQYIGEILSRLQGSKFLKNTLVVLTADHGEEFLEHRRKDFVEDSDLRYYYRGYGHGHTLYDEQIRVPLIIKFPDDKYANKRITSVVQLADILPTLLDVAGIPTERGRSGFEGISLVNYLRGGEAFPTRYAKSETASLEIKQIRSKSYKLIFKPQYDESVEFYDLSLDPMEQRNIAERGDEPYRRMLPVLESWVARMGKERSRELAREQRLAGTKARPAEKIDKEEREKLIKQLKALGYLQ